MKSSPLLTVLVVGGLFGWLAPGLSGGTFSAEGGARETAARAHPPERATFAGEGEVVLPREWDGHFYADVSVDGSSARMLVDTGASMIALTGADADAIGVYWDEADLRPVARGAGGVVHGVPVRLARVQVGELEAEGVEAVVVPKGLDVSLLGQSFLSQVERVEIDQDRMVLGS